MSWLVRAGRYAMPMLAARARAPVVRVARLHATRVPRAVEQSQGVSLDDPAEGEAQKLLDSGTHALEMGDLERAKGAYRKSVEVHENASAYYNLGICQYQERTFCATDARRSAGRDRIVDARAATGAGQSGCPHELGVRLHHVQAAAGG